MAACEGSSCSATWKNADRNKKAEAIDGHAPACGCEVHSLRNPACLPVCNDELVIRVLTSPDGYETSNGEVLTRKLTALFSSGVSLIRQGASDDEIKQTVAELTTTAEQNSLIGCVLVKASAIRLLEFPERSFCVYDTEDNGKTHHADILCTMPNQEAKSQDKRKNEAR